MLWSGKQQDLHFHRPVTVGLVAAIAIAAAPGATFSPRHIMDKINGIHATLYLSAPLLENCFRNTLRLVNVPGYYTTRKTVGSYGFLTYETRFFGGTNPVFRFTSVKG